jgi:hypothetical protein
MRYLKHCARLFAWVGLAVLAFALAAVWAPAAPALAAGDNVVIGAMDSPYIYGSSQSPTFQIIITLGQLYTTTDHWNAGVVMQIDGGAETFSSQANGYLNSSALNTATYLIILSSTSIPIGTHTASVAFLNAETGVTTTGSTNFSVVAPPPEMGCSLGPVSASGHYMPEATMQLTVSDGNSAFDWSQGNLELDLISNGGDAGYWLKLSSNGQATITLPTGIGTYQATCIYSTNQFPPDRNFQTLIIGMMNRATIHIYTNPTTVVYNQPFQIKVVFQGKPGLPAPTGQFSVDLRNGTIVYLHDGNDPVPANDEALMNIGLPATISSWNTIAVNYSGDGYYASQTATFTMTNPSISGSAGNGSGNSGATTKGTPTPKAPASPTEIATAASGPSTSGASATATDAFGPSESDWLIALSASAALLILLGAVTIYVVVARRREANFKQEAVSGAPPTPRWGGSTNQINPTDWRQPPTQPPYQW